MADSKKIVIVGIPGVGKTSLVTRLVELIRKKNKSVSVHSYGTVMLEEAKKTPKNCCRNDLKSYRRCDFH